MQVLQLEHDIRDFAMWKAAFDRDPIDRRGLGVRRHRVLRPAGEHEAVMVELEFETMAEAETCRAALGELWRSRSAAPALIGDPRVRIVELVEDERY